MSSVIIPVHNKLSHLDRSVYSVLNQTFEDFEILLMNDNSEGRIIEREYQKYNQRKHQGINR